MARSDDAPSERASADGASPATATRVAVLGGGVMGEAIIAAVLASGVDADDLDVSEPSAARATEISGRYGVRAADGNATVVRRADVVVVALKPKDVAGVLAEISPRLREGTLVVSIAAGLPTSFLEARLPEGTPVVRVMPNTPAVVGQGASAVSPGRCAGAEHVATVERLLAATGLVVPVAEKDQDAVTAISGSGPAYVFYLIDAMAEAGVLLGLTRPLALELATATVRGAATLLEESGEHPVVLRERVSSPGGTTVAALAALDAHGVRAGVLAAATAARDRARELAAELDG